MLRGINHVVLKVRSLEASDGFYGQLLGMQVVGRRGPMQFYTTGVHHHELALLELGDSAQSPGARHTGLFHLCFDVKGQTELRALHEKLQGAGIPVSGGVDHGIMRSFYTRDPDGNTIEVGYDIPRSEWENSDPVAEDHAFQI